jgi:HEPN domain-containing protein
MSWRERASVSSSAARLIANSLRVAREDLDAARSLSTTSNRNAIYLCEQAAEKVILAVLTSENKHGGVRHHLDTMVDLVPDENPVKSLLRAIEPLAAYATTYRYPTVGGRIPSPPTSVELGEWIRKVAVALDETVSRFGVDLGAKDAPASKPAPIR